MTTSGDRKVILATRGSALARWQSAWVAERLTRAHSGLTVETRVIRTSGDRFQAASLQSFGGKGAFTMEIEDALLAGEADFAVHSLKDLPTELAPGLKVWAYPPRFDPRDGWIGRDGLRYRDLKPGAVVATGALRRMSRCCTGIRGSGWNPSAATWRPGCASSPRAPWRGSSWPWRA